MEARERFFKDFLKICHDYGNEICLYWVHDLKTTFGITYSELHRVSNDLKHYFSQFFGDESRYIAVDLSENFFLPFFILGVWKNNGSFVPIGPQYSSKFTMNILNKLEVEFLITDIAKSRLLNEFSPISTFYLHNQKFHLCRRNIQKSKEIDEGGDMTRWDTCYGIMTSGSTGLPKVIQVPWSCILLNVEELLEEIDVTNSDCIFQSSPCTFDPFFIELFLWLLCGCSMMIVLNRIKLSPSDLLQCLFYSSNDDSACVKAESVNKTQETSFDINGKYTSRKPITILQMTPSIFRRWSDSMIKERIFSANTNLRHLILGGEKFLVEILQLKNPGNKTKIFNIYGITEISCWSFLNEIKGDCLEKGVSLGKSLRHVNYKINDNNELVIGSSKRICIIDNEKIDNSKEEIIFRSTGDIVHLSDNELYFISRSSQVVKKFGIKINIVKIQEIFLKSNKNMTICKCVFNDVTKKLALFYVRNLTNCSDFKIQSVEEFIQSGFCYPYEKLSDIERPDYIIEISNLPVNSHGKCDESILFDYLEKVENELKRNMELKIDFHRIWSDVLGLKTTSENSSFTESGGNSILALQLINKLEDVGLEIPSNFVVMLLNGESQEACLKVLQESSKAREGPRKKFKSHIDYATDNSIKLSVRWKFDLDKCIDATPSWFNYLGNERVIVGSHSSKISCINADTGRPYWTQILGDRIESSVAVTKDGSIGFVGCYDGFAYCLSMRDGSIQWKFETGDMIKSTPCLSDDEKTLFVASYDKFLYCLSVEDGSLRRRLKVSDKGIYSRGVVSEKLDAFFLASLDGSCIALCQTSMELNWRRNFENPIFSSPCLIEDDRIVFIEVVGHVHCLNGADGSEVWKYSVNGLVYSSPLCYSAGKTTNIIFGCNDKRVYCLNIKNKVESKWAQEVDSSVFARACLVDIGNDSFVCAASTKGIIYIMDVTSGNVRTSLKINGEVFSSPIIAGSKVFVGCRDNNIYALDIDWSSESHNSGLKEQNTNRIVQNNNRSITTLSLLPH